MTLAEFVKEEGGAEKVAAKLQMTGSAVRVWLRGEGTPTFGVAYTLVTASKGRLTLEQIMTESTRNKKKAKRR